MERGARLASRRFIQGTKTNWMNANGNRMRRNAVPVSNTITEKIRPRSEVKVMSPKPSVVIVTSVQ